MKKHPFTLFGITDCSKFPSGCRTICVPSRESTQTPLVMKGYKPFFSIVMTCKKVPRVYLDMAIWSLTCQTLKDFELVFVGEDIDDTQYVEDLCERNDIIRNVTCWADLKTRAERFKEGCHMARGQWIAVLDADDFLHPDALWTTYRCLKKFPIMNFFCGSHKSFNPDTGEQKAYPALPLVQSIKSLQHSFRQRHFWGFRNDPCRWLPRMFETQYPVEDYWLFSALAMECVPILHIPHYLYGWRVWGGQWTQREKQKCERMCDQIRRYLQIWGKKQSAMWHWGDMVLATRLNACMVRLEEEVPIGGDE